MLKKVHKFEAKLCLIHPPPTHLPAWLLFVLRKKYFFLLFFPNNVDTLFYLNLAMERYRDLLIFIQNKGVYLFQMTHSEKAPIKLRQNYPPPPPPPPPEKSNARSNFGYKIPIFQ